MTRKLILMLAIALTMFAVDAKAITCTPLPSECNGMTGSGSNSVTIQFTGPGGTITCTYDYCYCYICPDPILDPPNTPMKIYVWDIVSTNGCTDIDLDLVYDEIREGLNSAAFIDGLCGVPLCGSGNYRYIEYRIAACWYSLYIGNYLHFQPCPECTAQCLNITRICKDPTGYYYVEQVSSTLEGDLDCSTCEDLGFGEDDTQPEMAKLNPYEIGECYNVCH
jgi:hypothetical protein